MTLDELISANPRPVKISVQDASAIMGVTPRFLQMGLQQGRFPFGVGVEMSAWAYYINTERFLAYVQARDMRANAQRQNDESA